MAEENKTKVLKLTLNNNFIDKIVAQLTEMKTNHNKIVKIAGGTKDVVLVINHMDNDLNKKTDKKK